MKSARNAPGGRRAARLCFTRMKWLLHGAVAPLYG